MREDWIPIKLDVAVEMPDVLDLSALRGRGPQPGEEPLPEITGAAPPSPVLDQDVLKQLMDMGFPPEACKKAVYFTDNKGLEPATNWVMDHIGDSDFADPFVPPGTDFKTGNYRNCLSLGLMYVCFWAYHFSQLVNALHLTLTYFFVCYLHLLGRKINFVPNEDAVSMIMTMGFTQVQSIRALKATDNNVERAVDWIFSHQAELDSEDTQGAAAEPTFRDGESSE